MPNYFASQLTVTVLKVAVVAEGKSVSDRPLVHSLIYVSLYMQASKGEGKTATNLKLE